MRHIVLIVLTEFLVVCTSLTSCLQTQDQKAHALYEQAVEAFSAHKIGLAKNLADSIQTHYVDVPRVYADAGDLRRMISTYENRRTLAFLDSLLGVRQSELEPLMRSVDFEDKRAQQLVYVHNSQRTWRGIDRCYIRAYVEQNGNFYLSSNFVGPKAIHHTHVEVEADDGTYVRTDSVTDEAYLHTFSDGENVWEIVRYKGQQAANVAQLICADPSRRIVVTFQGPRAHYKTQMTETDKNAVTHIWRLGQLLRETNQIKSQIRQTRQLISKNKR